MASKSENPIIGDPDMKRYFDTLPPMVQVTIEQSGWMPQSVEDLQKAAAHLMQKE